MIKITIMKRFFGLVSAVIMLLSIQNLSAQNFKFGHINSDELFSLMPERDSVMSQLEALQTEFQNTLEIMQVELNNKYNDYLENMNKFTDLVRQTKEEELTSIQEKIRNFEARATTEMQTRSGQLMQPVILKAEKAIKDVAKANGFTYVFDLAQGPILYFDETKSENILPLVKAKLGIE